MISSRINLTVLLNEPSKVKIFNGHFELIRTNPWYRTYVEENKEAVSIYEFAALETQEWIEFSNQKQKENDLKRAKQAIEGIKK